MRPPQGTPTPPSSRLPPGGDVAAQLDGLLEGEPFPFYPLVDPSMSVNTKVTVPVRSSLMCCVSVG